MAPVLASVCPRERGWRGKVKSISVPYVWREISKQRERRQSAGEYVCVWCSNRMAN